MCVLLGKDTRGISYKLKLILQHQHFCFDHDFIEYSNYNNYPLLYYNNYHANISCLDLIRMYKFAVISKNVLFPTNTVFQVHLSSRFPTSAIPLNKN